MTIAYIRNLSVKKRLFSLIAIAVTTLVFVAGINLINLKEVSKKGLEIKLASEELLAGNKKNFQITKLIGDIHSSLSLFLQSGEKKYLIETKNALKELGMKTEKREKETKKLLKEVETLSIRIESLKENRKNFLRIQENLLKKIEKAQKATTNNDYIECLKSIISCFKEYNSASDKILHSTETIEIEDISKRTENSIQEIEKRLSRLSPKEALLFKEIINSLYDLDDAAVTVIAIKKKVASSQKKVINDLKKLEAFLGTETKDLGSRTATLVKESQEIVSKTFSISLVALGLSLTGIILLGLALSHSILDPIDRLVELLKKMSRGDLSSRLEVRGKDELALLADHFNRFLDHITSLVGQVRNSAKEVDGAAGSLDTLARQMLSEAKHSVAVAETAIGETERLVEFMKETSQMIESLAAATREISQNTTTAAGVARDLAQSMDETREIITHLSQQTQKIGSVIELIRSIAEQTSLLALNATIEAARAGEAGKGFAVVAGEVKELARQTAQATEEIAPIIEGILKEVNRAVKSVEANVEGTSRMQDAANTVATAVEEQTATYQEINHQVHNGSQMTEEVRIHIETLSQEAAQNLKEAQELTKRAEFLRSQSHRLEKMVRGLKV